MKDGVGEDTATVVIYKCGETVGIHQHSSVVLFLALTVDGLMSDLEDSVICLLRFFNHGIIKGSLIRSGSTADAPTGFLLSDGFSHLVDTYELAHLIMMSGLQFVESTA